MTDTAHFLNSTFREKLIEHLFLAELLRCLWCQGIGDAEVLRAEVDNCGYDLAIECNGILRYIQFKASYSGARTRRVGVNTKLMRKTNGCVIWIQFDPETLALGPYLWFGAPPNKPLPALGDRVGLHTRANSKGEKRPRPNIRTVAISSFSPYSKVDDLVPLLFGSDEHGKLRVRDTADRSCLTELQ
jgi:hypothetical protein